MLPGVDQGLTSRRRNGSRFPLMNGRVQLSFPSDNLGGKTSIIDGFSWFIIMFHVKKTILQRTLVRDKPIQASRLAPFSLRCHQT